MGAKQLTYSDEARQKLLSGVSKLARAVRCTLGPRGRNAVLETPFSEGLVQGLDERDDLVVKRHILHRQAGPGGGACAAILPHGERLC